MNEQLKNKIKELFKKSLEWDFDGTAWVSSKNYEESIKLFDQTLQKIEENNDLDIEAYLNSL